MTRLFDLTVGLLALLVLSPLLCVIAILVRIDSSGPAFFRQVRVGRDEIPFSILKFRSMRRNNGLEPAGPLVTIEGDARITRIGHILRSTKLDELPQLINVVRGDMSLVGPRPEVPKYVAEWTEEQRGIVLSVRPGITDPASVKFRRESELLAEQVDPESFYRTELLPLKAEMYADYVRNRSFGGDVKIIFGTLGSVFAK